MARLAANRMEKDKISPAIEEISLSMQDRVVCQIKIARQLHLVAVTNKCRKPCQACCLAGYIIT